MHIHSNNEVRRIYNVIGTIRGTVEPGKIICLQHNLRAQWPLHVLHGYKGEMRNILFSEILYCIVFEMVFARAFIWFRVCQHFHCKCWFSRGSHNQDGNICLQASSCNWKNILKWIFSPKKHGNGFCVPLEDTISAIIDFLSILQSLVTSVVL